MDILASFSCIDCRGTGKMGKDKEGQNDTIRGARNKPFGRSQGLVLCKLGVFAVGVVCGGWVQHFVRKNFILTEEELYESACTQLVAWFFPGVICWFLVLSTYLLRFRERRFNCGQSSPFLLRRSLATEFFVASKFRRQIFYGHEKKFHRRTLLRLERRANASTRVQIKYFVVCTLVHSFSSFLCRALILLRALYSWTRHTRSSWSSDAIWRKPRGARYVTAHGRFGWRSFQVFLCRFDRLWPKTESDQSSSSTLAGGRKRVPRS